MESQIFSEREKDVIRQLMQGKSNKQIALQLGISTRTVEFHLGNIYARLGVSTRSEAILKLSASPLRESTGALPVQTTGAKTDDSAENGLKPTLRSIPVKKALYLLAGLSAVVLIVIFGVLRFAPSTAGTVPTGQAAAANTPAAASPLAETEIPAVPTQASQPEKVVIPAHTVNGYTAAIESYYVDSSHVIFQVRISGGDISFGSEHFYSRIAGTNLYDQNGGVINTSGGWGPAVDPELVQFELVPLTILKGDRLKGQFAFDLTAASDYQVLAQFRFDFDLPMYPEKRFFPKQTISANGLEMLLDSVTVTPAFTQIYLCFPPPGYAPWTIGSMSSLQIGDRQAELYNSALLFSSAIGGDRRAGSEPYWAPPVKDGSCVKIGFQTGSDNPTSLTLTIPGLENSQPDVLLSTRLAAEYPGLGAREAYHAYLEEHDYVYKGPWVFNVELKP